MLPGSYKLVLSSDEEVFGGYRNLSKDSDAEHVASGGEHDRRPHSFMVYAPSRWAAGGGVCGGGGSLHRGVGG